ncbi:MAG: dTDP-4-dehydrorhamnose 3,5-epimerase [Flavobacteriales bacterium TMED191]|nr:MAG: dTDP-4-dehydrorhamnose 3,5-epimerase [Flavobacteriales bacterium TMED191]
METNKLTSNKGNLIEGPLILKPMIFNDQRGCFYESWNESTFYNEIEEKIIFFQDNHSISESGVLRGLHYQIQPFAQGKLVRCISGEIFDVVVDIRKNSPTFMEWGGINLNHLNKLMLWIPIGFAHGFLSLKDKTEVLYKVSGFYSKVHERCIRWSDPKIDIKWPLQNCLIDKPKLSEKDSIAPFIQDTAIFI